MENKRLKSLKLIEQPTARNNKNSVADRFHLFLFQLKCHKKLLSFTVRKTTNVQFMHSMAFTIMAPPGEGGSIRKQKFTTLWHLQLWLSAGGESGFL